MQNNAVIFTPATTSLYVIHADAMIEVEYKEERVVTQKEVLQALVDHFDRAILYLQERKKQIFK